MIFLRVKHDDGLLLEAILDQVESTPWLGIDLAIYGEINFSSSQRLRLSSFPEQKKSLHLNYASYTAQDIILGDSESSRRGLLKDISFAHRFNISSAALHWTRGMRGRIPSVAHMREVLSTFEDAEIQPYIENLVWNFDYQAALIDIALGSGYPFGVCFDIGHAKLWGEKPFGVWLLWLKELHANNVNLIFHIHGNNGEKDDHLPLGVCNEGGRFAPSGMTDVVRTLLREFPNASFVLETKTCFAISNANWFAKEFADEIGNILVD